MLEEKYVDLQAISPVTPTSMHASCLFYFLLFIVSNQKMENKNIAVGHQQMASRHSSACLVSLCQGAKKAKKAQRPLKKQMSSPNIQRKEKPEKVSQLILSQNLTQSLVWRKTHHSYYDTTR